jgi:molecular chaperone GrpE
MSEKENPKERKKWMNYFRSNRNQAPVDQEYGEEGGTADAESVKVSAPEKEVEEESREEILTRENSELKDKLLRTLAELENTRRRVSEEREKMAKFAIAEFARDLIPIAENLQLAMDSIARVEKTGDLEVFYTGVDLTLSELKKVFIKNNMNRIYPLNDKFDPNYHEAIASIENENESGTVLQVMQAGYSLNGRVLKPALVAVAK